MREARRDKDRSVGSYIASVIGNAIVLFLVNKVPEWDLRFITDGYTAVLWAMNLSLIVQIAGNALLVFFHPLFIPFPMTDSFHFLHQGVYRFHVFLGAF